MQSNNAAAPLAISQADLDNYRTLSGKMIQGVSWEIATVSQVASNAGITTGRATLQKSILEIARKITGDDILIDEIVNSMIIAVRNGLKIGLHLANEYGKASGLDTLRNQNKRQNGFDSDATRAEFHAKNQTSAYICCFVWAHYVLNTISELVAEKAADVTVVRPGWGGVDFTILHSGSTSGMFYYAQALEDKSVVSSAAFVKMTHEYFQGLLDSIAARAQAGSIKFAEAFTAQSYKLEDSDFLVKGFEVERRDHAGTFEFRKMTFDRIVGNAAAKHETRRMISRLLSYDRATQRNPFQALTGTFQAIRLGYGLPGTGKGMQIMATATLLQERCEMIGIPFIYHPLFASVVSSYQGKSGSQMEDWFRVLNNPDAIIYAPIDDAEQVLMDRTLQSASEGSKGVVSAYLVGTEGAGAVWVDRCNVVQETYTNLPDQIDPAVMSRHQSRFPLHGAKRWEDFVDQGYIWWRPIKESLSGLFDTLAMPTEYQFVELQKEMRNMGEVLGDLNEPTNGTMRDIFEKTQRECNPQSVEFFARLSANVQNLFPNFSSREERNIQAAVSARLIDFEFPDTWETDPEEFYRQPYDRKLALLKEVQRESLKGLKFVDVWRQEVCRYLDAFAEIQAARFERDVAAEVARMEVHTKARERFESKT